MFTLEKFPNLKIFQYYDHYPFSIETKKMLSILQKSKKKKKIAFHYDSAESKTWISENA